MKAQISLQLPYNGSSQLFAYTEGYARSIGISEIAGQRSDENDDPQWGNGRRAIKSIAGIVGRDVISFRPRVCSCHNIRILRMVTQNILPFMDYGLWMTA
jgi:hypothetical protein